MITEGEARQIIGVEGAGVLIDVVQGGWDAHLAEQAQRSRRTRANVVWDHMIEQAEGMLAPMDGVRAADHQNTRVYILRERMIMRFKKHDRGLLTRNYPTRAQQSLTAQGHFAALPDLDHVSCGYVLDAAEAGIERIVVVRRVADYVEWFIDLFDLAAGNLTPVTQLLPGLPGHEADVPQPSIVPIRRVQNDGE